MNLAPADVRKEGTGFDLAIAVGILRLLRPDSFRCAEIGCISWGTWSGWSCLPGSWRSSYDVGSSGKGLSSLLCTGCQPGRSRCCDRNPCDRSQYAGNFGCFSECRRSDGSTVSICADRNFREEIYDVDFSEVNGQKTMRRAAEVAAAGMHNLFMMGTPGSGKTMIARRIPTILPELTREESLEVTGVRSACGTASARMLSDADPSVAAAASYGICSRTGGRRTATASGRDFVGTPRRIFSGSTAGIFTDGAGGAASASLWRIEWL